MLQTADKHLEVYEDPFEGQSSVKGKQWRMASADLSRVESLVQGYGLPEIVARLLVTRDIDHGDVRSFLKPTLSNHFPNPFSLHNMDVATDFIASAVKDGKKIGILADFDVDGATSCAVMKRYLNAVGCKDVPFFIPDRLNDGYGPSTKGFDRLKEQGAEIVVILDCGITSIAPITHAQSIGLQTIVIDHHEPDSALPPADYIINPKLHGDNSGLDYLAAVGVTFLFCVGFNSKLRQSGHFEGNEEPSMRTFLDLVALGTVCDMVPLVEANRLFVKQGFPMMSERANPGLKALLEVSKITTMPDPYHAGFMLGPRINAGSRVHHSELGAELLSTEDPDEAMRIAWLLDDCNEKRKDIQKDMTRQASEKAKAMMIENPHMAGLVIDGQGWHSGLSGLVAGAIKDKHEKPTCVITYVENEDGVMEGRASGRSVKGIHIAEIFLAAQKDGLIVKGGGHAMAGGFTIMPDRVDAFRAYFHDKVIEQIALGGDVVDNAFEEIELSLAVRSLNIKTAEYLTEAMAPFGMGNPEPTMILSNVRVDYADQVGANHLRTTIKDAEGSVGIKAMAFRALDSDLGVFLKSARDTGQIIHLKGQVKINEWQGRRSVEFHIDDAMGA